MTAAVPFDVRDAPHPQRMLVLFGALPILAVLIFIIGIAFGVRGEDIALLALALVTAVVACIPVVFDQGRAPSQRRVLLSLLCLMYLGWFVTPVFAYYIPAPGPVDAPGMTFTMLGPRDVAVGQVIALAGLLALLVGHTAAGARWFVPLLPRARRDWPPHVVLGVAFSMLLLGWGVYMMGFVVSLTRVLGSGIASTLQSGHIYGNVLLTYALLRHRSRIAFLALCFTIPFTSLLGFFSGSKLAVLVAPTMVLVTGIVYRRRIRARWILLGLLSLALLYPAQMFFRNEILVGNTLTAADALRTPTQTLSRVYGFVAGQRPYEYFVQGLAQTGGRLDCLGVTSVVVRDTPDRVPYQYGRTLGLFFVAFVPRVLWAGKPDISTGQWMTSFYGSGSHIGSSTGPCNPGDHYLNFGAAGVIAGMLLLGVIVRITHECLLGGGQPTAAGLLAAIAILYQLVLRFEGNVAIQYSTAVFAVVPILATHLLIRSFLPPPRPTPADARGGLAADGRLGT